MADLDALCLKLRTFRDGAVEELAGEKHLLPGLMRLIADADAVLLALDRAAAPPDAPAGERIIVTHPGHGEPITMTIYQGADAIARMELSPARALAVGVDLIQAARWESI